ncbi:hypothetical protein [Yoonia maritima]|uniref:hypothetical protein n=1 Tax=Yoonia maritima TaxID=1435347 RepID=UPI0013A65D78|nr:hypothetical protein [Yoonia maritima]
MLTEIGAIKHLTQQIRNLQDEIDELRRTQGIVALATMRHSRRPAYGLAVVWALVGIVVANGTAPLGVSILAGIGAVVLLGLSVASSGHSVPS